MHLDGLVAQKLAIHPVYGRIGLSPVGKDDEAIASTLSSVCVPDNTALHNISKRLEGLEKDLLGDLTAQVAHKHLEPGALLLLGPRGSGCVLSPRNVDGLEGKAADDERAEIRQWNKMEMTTLPKISLSLSEFRAYSADL